MMFGHSLLAMTLTLLLAAPAAVAAEDPAIGVDYQELTVNGNNRFAFDLYGTLSTKEKGNLFISPYSISAALAMTWSGARGNTEREMSDTLHFPLGQLTLHQAFAGLQQGMAAILAKGDVSLTTANSIWPQAGLPLLERYVQCLEENYRVTVTPLDYVKEAKAARLAINRWVETKTAEKIRDLIPPGSIDSATEMVLVNAIHFKGNWASRFNPATTRPEGFSLPDGTVKQVPTMIQQGTFAFGGDEGAMVLELPYQGGNLSMLILLPRSRDGLPALEAGLTAGRLADLQNSMAKKELWVSLPKFGFTWGTTDLVAPLTRLGMKEAFTGRADFSGMTGERGLFISQVLHKAFIEVNEEGSEAAAATAVTMKRSSPPALRIDHPFIFLIRDNVSGSILFLGRVADPLSAG